MLNILIYRKFKSIKSSRTTAGNTLSKDRPLTKLKEGGEGRI